MPEYSLLPTSKGRGSTPPPGWVQFAPGMNTKRRTMTEGYLNQRMPRSNTVAMNQNYVRKVLFNPNTPPASTGRRSSHTCSTILISSPR